MLSLLASLVLIGNVFSAPTKRQLNGTLAGLQGVIGGDINVDYVVVGGGTAGLTIAKRLAEDPETTVAVIEAGSLYQITDPIIASTPGGDVVFCGSSAIDNNPLVDWSFFTEPQAGGADRKVHYARGKCLGGSSARNFMIYQRGTVESYQMWADAVGDDSYTWDNILPYFQKSISFTPPNTATRAANASAEYNPDAFITSGGPLQVSYANYAQSFSSYIEGSMNEIGIPTTEDFNSGKVLGAQYCASTINPDGGHRETSQTSYLDSAASFNNLKVYSATTAQKILFDDNKKATGVAASTAGVDFTINATQEVILSAGAFQSPQLLMLSGIGPADQLSEFDIPVIADRPGVGQNMTDHIFFGPSYRVDVETFTKLANSPTYIVEQFAVFETEQQGPLTNPVADFLGWEKVPSDLRSSFSPDVQSALAAFPDDWPEIEYIGAPGYVGDFGSLLLDQPKDGYQYATVLGTLVAPLSRGTVTLKTDSANDLPAIDPNWLTDPTDKAVAVAAYKRVRQMFASNFMAPIRVGGDEYFPGPDVQSDEDILNVIAETLMTVWHASVTCRMGLADDPTAVVDSKAKVIGVEGLRVVDASSFAILPPGHPQSTIYMLAEKIADDIKNGQ